VESAQANQSFAETHALCVATFGQEVVDRAADELLMEALENTGSIAHLNHEGDTTYTWNRKNEAECEAAKEHFAALKKKGFLAFKVNRMGCKQKKPTDTFDQKAGKYIYTAPDEEFDPKSDYVVTPQMRGG
jgi:hypothetical protein